MKSKHMLVLMLCLGVSLIYMVSGCGDDDAQGTCESACNRISSCADSFGIDPAGFSAQACNADCGTENPEKIACVGGCDVSPNCLAYAACLGGCGVDFDED